MQSPPTTREIEAALTQGVRDRLADGWTLVDVQGDQDELSLTLTKGKQVEAHVAHIDGKNNAYRIDVVAMPQHPIAPDPQLVLSLAAPNGGIELTNDCGHSIARPYMIETTAKGAAAGRLVAKTLKASRDVEGTDIESDHATFVLSMKDKPVELVVTLDSEIVVAAEIRNYGWGRDTTRYKRMSQLRKKLGATVTAISTISTVAAGAYDVVLDGDKRFVIDIDSYEENFPDAHDGCGC
jgi:hypothetical protein